jgi:tRNA threonylcarbamoyladenosine biosynthesis protein TsaB
MNLLALDTCSECCSAALFYDGHLYEVSQLTQRGHSELILGMMDRLFEQAGTSIASVEALAFGRGPGSFTGVRIGVSVAQGIAFARDIPVIPISSLAAVAQQAANDVAVDQFAVAIDARMGEIYCAHYQRQAGLAILVDQERVCIPSDFLPLGQQNTVGVGTGWQTYGTELRGQFSSQLVDVKPETFPMASRIIDLAQVEIAAGRLLSAEQALPVYLRDNVAKKKAEQGHG